MRWLYQNLNITLIMFLFPLLSNINGADFKQNSGKLNFSEIRRQNSEIKLKVAEIIDTKEGIRNLYKVLANKEFSKSAPIPNLINDSECLLLLKPKLKKVKFGDIEVDSLRQHGSILTVYYREIANWEYAEQKQSNPLLILKILDRSNKINTIKLINTPLK
ncbi:hypothetical protein EG347_21920 [Chryseobacterium sp. G0186]|uniref:hypothetical protein n=1 Tax=Chryseobacterium sp. G0186 TaxID=2487064 RepID=UPI000F50E825|nr:hypothetical protein [Chryseobacterium sp. G0186]AZA79952.1 hypothetical protein EG347_21920 [Chryseobacterium sp. G0186]